jgi:uncharacterized protein (DUF58 family)
MLPIPTQRALAVLAGVVGMWLVGLLARSWAATLLGSAMAMLLVGALAATVPLGRRVRAQRLEFAWWLGHANGPVSGAVVPGVPFQIRCYVRHRGTTPIALTAMEPIVPGATVVVDRHPSALEVAPRARNEFAFSLMAKSAGRVVLHGLAVSLRGPLGLFDVPLYFPNALAVKVLPRSVALRSSPAPSMAGLPLDRAGRHRMRRRGGGTELHELREYQPGDPFKSIAWKASAKAGQLRVREVDQEVQQTLMLAIDVGGSMRGGAPGERKLDFALELSAAQARAWLERGDRVGLLIVDGRVLSQVEPGEGPAHLIRIYDALLAATEVVDADLTTLDDREVVELVARYVRHQDGLDFSVGRDGRWDVQGLAAHVRKLLPQRGQDMPQAQTGAGAELRRFCRERGIALPHRVTPFGGDKAKGLSEALRRAAGHVRAPRAILLVTDLDGVVDYDLITATTRLLHRRGHSMSVAMPDARAIANAPNDASIEADLSVVYGRAEERRLREARQMLGRMGVPVSSVGPGHMGFARSKRSKATRVA